MPLPLRHLSLLRPFFVLSETMPEPAYHVRCSGKQDFHCNLVEEKVFGCLRPFAMHMGASQTCCRVVFVEGKC